LNAPEKTNNLPVYPSKFSGLKDHQAIVIGLQQ